MSIRFLWHRTINLLRAELSYALSLLGVVRVRHLPTFVSIEPANRCQLHCPQCPIGTQHLTAKRSDSEAVLQRQRSDFQFSNFQILLPQIAPYAHTMQFYFQGEPLLNPDLPKMIALAHQAGLYTIVSTNAQALTPLLAKQLVEAGLSRIIISIDGMSEQSYSAYRVGGSLHKALDGLTYLRQAKEELGASVHIELQCLRLKSNEHEWAAMKKLYRTMGADSLTLKTAQFYNFEHGDPLMPSDERYSRYTRQADGTYRLKHRHTHACHRLWTGAVITTTGELLPCCMDKAAQYSFGNVFAPSNASSKRSPYEQCYHSLAANRFRTRLLRTHFDLPICRNC